MITTEQALDILPVFIDMVEKIGLEEYMKKNKGKSSSAEEDGLKLIKYIAKNTKKVKPEIFEVVSIAESMPIEDVKKQSVFKTINTFKGILKEEGVSDFFAQAMQ